MYDTRRIVDPLDPQFSIQFRRTLKMISHDQVYAGTHAYGKSKVPNCRKAPDPESKRSKRRSNRGYDPVRAQEPPKRLQERSKQFEDLRGEGTGNRPGSKYVRPHGGKVAMYHKPGSRK